MRFLTRSLFVCIVVALMIAIMILISPLSRVLISIFLSTNYFQPFKALIKGSLGSCRGGRGAPQEEMIRNASVGRLARGMKACPCPDHSKLVSFLTSYFKACHSFTADGVCR